MSLSSIARLLREQVLQIEEYANVEGTQERLALTGTMAIQELGLSPEHTSPAEVRNAIAQLNMRLEEHDRAAEPRGCRMLSEGDACDCELCKRDNEIHRLREMIDKLPKCWRLGDDGGLYQDEIVLPGMVLWSPGIEQPERVEVVSLEQIDSDWPATVRMEVPRTERAGTYNWAVRNCYSSQAAAEAAKKGNES